MAVRVGFIVLVLALLSPSAFARPAASAARSCGKISVKEVGTGKTAVYVVKVLRGRVTCVKARSVLKYFTVKGVPPRGWVCFRGHSSQGQKWAASCAKGRALVRSYGPIEQPT